MSSPAEMLQSIASGLERAATSRTRVQSLVDELTWELRALRRTMAPGEWKGFVAQCRTHPLCGLVHQDPFTRWMFQRPQADCRDATLLDFIYGKPAVANLIGSASELGQSLFARNRNAPSCRAIRYRTATLVDRLSSVEPGRVYSLACSHLREMRHGTSGKFTTEAFDGDKSRSAKIPQNLEHRKVSTVLSSLKRLAAETPSSKNYAFVYAAGLYDYLSTPLAQRITQLLFGKVAAGGTLHFASFAKNSEDAGFLEAYMDWWLIFRDEAEMLEIASAVPRSEIDSIRTYRDPDRHIVFMELTRSGQAR